MSYDPSKERIPHGVTHIHPGKNSFPIAELSPYVEAGRKHTNTFDVEPAHHIIADGKGVCFNVETVPEPLREHRHKVVQTRSQLFQTLKRNTAIHYNTERRVNELECDSFDRVEKDDVRLEAVAEASSLVHVGNDGFVMALVTAFAQHLPLTLSPDHIWMVIAHVFATHVEQNADALQHHFVQHDGKKRLYVQAPAGFTTTTTSNNDPDSGASSSADWESLIFPAFSNQIQQRLGETTYNAITANFSTTSPTCRAAHEIALLSAMKNYCSYGFGTSCGIPTITLLVEEVYFIMCHFLIISLKDVICFICWQAGCY